ncbi:general secretion pathway protein GspK [Methylomonas sp. LL1]|uniref:general secretion pathway protein GspK n=1 Tax=Methylomonas sp. LL1 TaxID=2785785 RepID=UPI0018C382FD|nr:type II secretion system protein GspK [Methylomonas sp. LL1]QPK64644.1 general secretion pathway protein GspK [Methylomonas sp. LL1]
MSPKIHKPQRSKSRNQGGMALVIVIWILTLLSLMAGSFAMSMRRETSVSSAIKNNAEAQALAESGIMLAEFMLTQPDPRQRWLANGSVYRLEREESEIRIRIFSESGKVDINAADEALLAAVLKSAVDDDWQQRQLLNAILDWRDADDDTRTQGAERRQYQQAGLSYGPANSGFQSLEELQLVLGMTERIFNAIQPWITVYSGQAQVNQDQASPELLAILAEDLKQRNIQDASLQQHLDAVNNPDSDIMDSEQSAIGENQAFTIIAEARLHDEAASGLEAVVKSQGIENPLPFETLDWKQNLTGLSLFDEEMENSIITIQDEFRYDDRI